MNYAAASRKCPRLTPYADITNWPWYRRHSFFCRLIFLSEGIPFGCAKLFVPLRCPIGFGHVRCESNYACPFRFSVIDNLSQYTKPAEQGPFHDKTHTFQRCRIPLHDLRSCRVSSALDDQPKFSKNEHFTVDNCLLDAFKFQATVKTSLNPVVSFSKENTIMKRIATP